MKLNTREKIMLISLAILGVIAASYFFLLQPKFDRIDSLYIEEEAVMLQIQNIERELASGANLDEDIDNVKLEIEEATTIFYPEILLEKIIVIIDDIVNKVNIKNDSLALSVPMVQGITVFQRTAQQESYYIKDIVNQYIVKEDEELTEETEPIEEIPAVILNMPDLNKRLDVLTINMSLNGTYEQIIEFIDEIESLQRTVKVNSLSFSTGAEDLMSVSMSLIFYAIPKMNDDQDDEYYEWPFENEYGKDNPFLSLAQ